MTPTFDFSAIKEVVDRHVQNYDAGLEKRALNHIADNWDTIPQRIKDLKKGGTKAKQTKRSMDTLANQTVATQPKDGLKKSDRDQNWKPNLDNTEWGIVKYTVDKNQGTAITSTCNMFFKKSKGKTLFGIYSTDDSTLLYASRGQIAEKERIFVERLREEYKNGNVPDTSAEGLRAWSKAIRMQRTANDYHGSENVAPGRSAGDAGLHGRPSRLYARAALRNVLENIFPKETARRTGDGRVKNSDRNSDRYNAIASDFTSHMVNIVKTNRGWYAKDVFKYVEEHPEVGFIELIYAKDKDANRGC